MDESDEERVLLEDDSMDEMHEIESDLVASVDTNASPVKSSRWDPRFGGSDDKDESDSDKSDLFGGSSSDDEDEPTWRPSGILSWPGDAAHPKRLHDSEEDDGEEPPEIPGSPLRTAANDQIDLSAGGRMNRLRDMDTSKCGENRRQHRPAVEILQIHANDSDEDDVDEAHGDYETKESEAPRAMEFHTSSSDSESEGSGIDGSSYQTSRTSQQRPNLYQPQERPKTAVKVLEQYRDVLPRDYYDQIVGGAPKSPIKEAAQSAHAHKKDIEPPVPVSNLRIPGPTRNYKLRVPKEIEELFTLVDAFNPEPTDIPTRLHPFIPEYVPVVGLPFDGIQIPRPDGKADSAGIAFVREPCAQSNAAELELLLSVEARKRRHNRADEVTRVHSISDAAHRPKDIDQWIASVTKAQASRPPPRVLYKRPIPSETSLMELWPEEFESFLVAQAPLPVSSLDVSLPELIRIVCGILDIPVYDGFYVHSLHALFSLYNEVVAYEKEVLGKRGDSR